MRKTVGARELKTRLGTYLREVSRGRTIVVTERGEPVAELRPIRRSGNREEARLEELVALGILTRTSKKPLAPFKAVKVKGAPVSETVIEDREDRF